MNTEKSTFKIQLELSSKEGIISCWSELEDRVGTQALQAQGYRLGVVIYSQFKIRGLIK